MGRKNIRKGKYIFICFACLIIPLLFSCATLKGIEERHNVRKSLAHSQRLIAEGDFNAAIKENLNVLMSSKGRPGDEALFNIGLIYAHYANPEKDYDKARNYFAKLVEEFPGSPFAEQARVWIAVLKEVSARKTVADKKKVLEKKSAAEKYIVRGQKLLGKGDFKGALRQMKKALSISRKSPYGETALFYMGLVYAHHDNPEKDYKKSHSYFERVIKEYPASPLAGQSKIWIGILNVIEKAKQVDIEIERKKKELTR